MSVFLTSARQIVRTYYADGDWHSPYAQDALRDLPGVSWARARDLMDRLVVEGTLERRRAPGANFGHGGNEYRLAPVVAEGPTSE